jgi:hypothetical protein
MDRGSWLETSGLPLPSPRRRDHGQPLLVLGSPRTIDLGERNIVERCILNRHPRDPCNHRPRTREPSASDIRSRPPRSIPCRAERKGINETHMIVQRMMASIKTLLSLLPVVALLALLAAACGETPVDQNTANVTKRSPRDSTIYHDSTLWKDSVISRDTIIVIYRDSLVKRDTVLYRDSVITRTHDSVIVAIHDSVSIVIRDSVRITYRDSVVTKVRDSIVVVRKDSTITKIRDSVVVVRRDTLIRRFDQSAVRSGTIYFHDLNGRPAQVPLLVDSATRLTIELSPNGPTGLRLDLMGHPPEDLWSADRKLAPLPVWLHLSLPYLALTAGTGSGLPAGDPIFGPGFGVLQRSHLAPTPLWMHTGTSGNSASFSVDAVDTASRLVHARFRAEFTTPEPLRIDSARIVMSY